MDFGREKLHWTEEAWNRLDRAVDAEVERTSISRKVLPLYGPISEGTTAVPSDIFDPLTGTVDEGQTTALIELSSEFFLTPQQVEKEAELGTAVTAAVSRANLVTLAEDLLVFQGRDAAGAVVALPPNVIISSGQPGIGLLNSAGAVAVPVNRPAARAQRKGALAPAPLPYGENTVTAVNAAVAQLQGNQHYGPYALVLHTDMFADAHAPLATTLIMPADRIKPVVTGGLHSSSSLPQNRGVLLSLGGNSMDVVRSVDVTTAFSQVDPQGRYRFRVFQRFVLRVKRDDAVARLEFA